MSDTPRTDAEEKYTFSRESLDVDEDGSFISTYFARKLERENAKLCRELAEARALIIALKIKVELQTSPAS